MAQGFVLSGFADERSYSDREPSWEPEDEYSDVEQATTAAQAWLIAQASVAQVEVIELTGNEGHVRRVVGQGGVEDIG